MEIDGYTVEPLTSERWEDFEAILGRSGVGGCWCTYWIHPNSGAWGEGCKGGSQADNKRLFQKIVTEGPPPGLIAYDNETPVGWCRVMPRTSHPGLANSRFFKTALDVAGVWSLSCFVVSRPHRGRGMTTILTKAAMQFAHEQGGRILEAYPWDTTEQKSPSTIYTGMASTFLRLGFEVVQRKVPHKPMMRFDLGAA